MGDGKAVHAKSTRSANTKKVSQEFITKSTAAMKERLTKREKYLKTRSRPNATKHTYERNMVRGAGRVYTVGASRGSGVELHLGAASDGASKKELPKYAKEGSKVKWSRSTGKYTMYKGPSSAELKARKKRSK